MNSKYEHLRQTSEGISLCDHVINMMLELRLEETEEEDEEDVEFVDEFIKERILTIKNSLQEVYQQYEQHDF